MNASKRSWLATALVLVAVACQKEAAKQEPAAQAMPATQPAAGMDSMGGMAGMSGAQMGTQMMAQMQSMGTMHGDSLKQMVPQHRQMLGNMMSLMDREMMGMNKAADPKWTALADSVRDDQTRMQTMSAAEIEALMPAHQARITRLMEMHRSMMGGM